MIWALILHMVLIFRAASVLFLEQRERMLIVDTWSRLGEGGAGFRVIFGFLVGPLKNRFSGYPGGWGRLGWKVKSGLVI